MTSSVIDTTEIDLPLKDALRTVPTLADLRDEEIQWLADHAADRIFEPGDVLIREGDPAEDMTIVLKGEMRFRSSSDEAIFIAKEGRITGMLPHSRLERYMGTVRATTRLRIAAIHKSLFAEMLEKVPVLGPRLIAIMADRIRETASIDQQHEKLMALGKLSAGLAHELNNPSAAIGRATASLRESLRSLNTSNHKLAGLQLSDEQSSKIAQFEASAKERLANAPVLDSLQRSDLEDELTLWLEDHGIEEGWRMAPVLADGGITIELLDQADQLFSPEMLPVVLERGSATLAIERLLQGIESSSGRISSLIQSIKEYTFMDQGMEQEVDIHRGLENTLTMLAHELKAGIKVNRIYDHSLPKICAWGSELNQVWTNLIDNAVDAMGGRGTLTVRTAKELDLALVQISDDGPGIPSEVQDRIFEPFFTTKGVGQGTGLGLDVVYRIIRKHRGSIHFTSQPGETVFQVRLPIPQPKRPAAEGSAA